MYSLEVIKHLNAEVADRAREEGTEPLLVTAIEDLVGIPTLGDACADVDATHERLDTLFCDTSGFGAPHERALTFGQLQERVLELLHDEGDVLLAVEEAGQFQAYVAVWRA